MIKSDFPRCIKVIGPWNYSIFTNVISEPSLSCLLSFLHLWGNTQAIIFFLLFWLLTHSFNWDLMKEHTKTHMLCDSGPNEVHLVFASSHSPSVPLCSLQLNPCSLSYYSLQVAYCFLYLDIIISSYTMCQMIFPAEVYSVCITTLLIHTLHFYWHTTFFTPS